MRRNSVRFVRSATSGSALVPHTITPATVMPRALATSTVSAVWLSVPRPGRATIASGSSSASARSANVSRSLIGTSSPPEPSTRMRAGLRAQLARRGTIGSRLGSGAPSRRAATAGRLPPGSATRFAPRSPARARRSRPHRRRAPGLRRLEHGHAPAALHAGGGERGRHVRLADARVGPGDEQVAERRQRGRRHAASAYAASSASASRSLSSSLIESGGQTTTASPSGRITRPCRRAARQTAAPPPTTASSRP